MTISVPFCVRRPLFPPVNATIPTTLPHPTIATTVSAYERRADVERRLDEAADVIAETLLDMWRGEQRARRAAANGGAS